MNILAKTDIGKAREMNQDCYYIPGPDEELKLYIVADGMGGYNGGDVASNLAVFTSKKYIYENVKQNMQEEDIKQLLINAIYAANKAVFEKSQSTEELEEMGTTLDICFIYNNKMYIGHIGDSRVYKIKENKIEQITTDHSYVQKLLKEGSITEEEAKNHPKRNMLMKALGTQENEEPDIYMLNLETGDIILMCTDGLTNLVNEEDVCEIITQDIHKSHEILIETANKKGGMDNITVIIIENIS